MAQIVRVNIDICELNNNFNTWASPIERICKTYYNNTKSRPSLRTSAQSFPLPCSHLTKPYPFYGRPLWTKPKSTEWQYDWNISYKNQLNALVGHSRLAQCARILFRSRPRQSLSDPLRPNSLARSNCAAHLLVAIDVLLWSSVHFWSIHYRTRKL